MRHCAREPVAAGFDELALVQASAFFAPARTAGDGFKAVNQVALHPVRRAIPLDVRRTMIEVDGTRTAVQSEPAPVPEFEGEDVGSGADFEHHAVFARAVHRAGGNQEVVVLLGGRKVDVLLRRETAVRPLVRASDRESWPAGSMPSFRPR